MLSIPTLLLGLVVTAATTKPPLVPAPAGDVTVEQFLRAARNIAATDSIEAVKEKAKSLGAPDVSDTVRGERSAHWVHRVKGWTYSFRVIFLRHPKHRDFYPAIVGITRVPDPNGSDEAKQEMLYFETPAPGALSTKRG